MKQALAEVVASNEIMPGAYLTWLEAPQIAAEAGPGQFAMIRCGEDSEMLLPRPLSIHQRSNSRVALLFNVVGKGTAWLSKYQAGSNLKLLGPLGNGFSINPASHNLLLIAGGMGIAPLYFLAQEALRRKYAVTLLYGTAIKHRYPEELLPAGIELIDVTEDGSVGRKGVVTELLPDFADWADQVFACGPVSMYRDMSDKYGQLFKDKPAQVSLELRMACGRGVCYGCTLKMKDGLKRVCEDGPIFGLEQILWDEL